MKTYGSRASLLYTDTDSFIIKLKTKDINSDLIKIKSHLDTSNFPPSHRLYSKDNASKIGFFKSEIGSQNINIFISTKAKSYHYICDDEKCNKLKGVDKSFVSTLETRNYLKSLIFNSNEKACFTKLSSRHHRITMDRVTKNALSSFDDKIKLFNCSIHISKYGENEISKYCDCPFSKIVK